MKSGTNIKLVATDLDGTLLNDSHVISETDKSMLLKLGNRRIVRVAATGRSLHKVREVLTNDAPFDYIIFSSGSGIYDWQRQILLVNHSFQPEIIKQIALYLEQKRYNFFIFQPIPNNNQFSFHRGESASSEFERYLERHFGDHTPLNLNGLPSTGGQFLVIIDNNFKQFDVLSSDLMQKVSGIRVIRTTSPVDGNYIWTEIFPDTVSKGHGIAWLCNYLNINTNQTCGIGNDYNDQEMLDFVKHPFVVGNAPDSLQLKYRQVKETNQQHGFSCFINQLIEM